MVWSWTRSDPLGVSGPSREEVWMNLGEDFAGLVLMGIKVDQQSHQVSGHLVRPASGPLFFLSLLWV